MRLSRDQFAEMMAKIIPMLTEIGEIVTAQVGTDGEKFANIQVGNDGYIHFDIRDGKGTWNMYEYKGQNPCIGFSYIEDLKIEGVS